MALWIQVSPGSNLPIYLQVVDQISEAIAKGELSAGDRLPSVRKLAAELVINPNTVYRSYGVLEQAGLVATKTGSGTFVNDPQLRSRNATDINILTRQMDATITRGLNLGFTSQDLIEVFEKRLVEFGYKAKTRKKK